MSHRQPLIETPYAREATRIGRSDRDRKIGIYTNSSSMDIYKAPHLIWGDIECSARHMRLLYIYADCSSALLNEPGEMVKSEKYI